MAFLELDWLAVTLRLAVYLGTIAAAGAVLFRLTMAPPALLSTALARQTIGGASLLVIAATCRYLHFQIQIAGGDVALAFDPSMRWIAFETAMGQAAAIRFTAAIVLLVAPRSPIVGTLAATALVGSYLFEGHTVAEADRWLIAPLLAAHLVIAHWWIGSLYPLWQAARSGQSIDISAMASRFGTLAVGGVAVLTIAGAILLGALTGWSLDPANPYHQGFALKLTTFAAILAIAAINKLIWTPRLANTSDTRARSGFSRSLAIEFLVAICILAATAIATSFSPGSM